MSLLECIDFTTYVTGSAQPKLTIDNLANIELVVPPISEQTAIAAYLDDKTTKIDILISNKQKLIELLKEEKVGLINEAVTKGVNRHVPLKPSGINWLGDVPEHWEVKKLKYVLESIIGGGTPSTNNPSFWNGYIPWVSPKDMEVDKIERTEDYVTELAIHNSSTSMILANSVLIVVRSGILKHTLPVAINLIPVSLNQDMKALKPNSEVEISYLFWLLKGYSDKILTFCNKIGATVDSIEMDDLVNFYIAIPPISEQSFIVEYIETETSKIEYTISRIEKEIELMQEYRTALISEVVTGQVKVVD